MKLNDRELLCFSFALFGFLAWLWLSGDETDEREGSLCLVSLNSAREKTGAGGSLRESF